MGADAGPKDTGSRLQVKHCFQATRAVPCRTILAATPHGMTTEPLYDKNWSEVEAWWIGMGGRLHVADRAQSFFKEAAAVGLLDRIAQIGGQVDYILFVLMRYWVPTVLPPAGRERLTKNDPDYWLESEQLLKAAAARLRELKPLIELLTTPSPLSEPPAGRGINPPPVAELELSHIVE